MLNMISTLHRPLIKRVRCCQCSQQKVVLSCSSQGQARPRYVAEKFTEHLVSCKSRCLTSFQIISIHVMPSQHTYSYISISTISLVRQCPVILRWSLAHGLLWIHMVCICLHISAGLTRCHCQELVLATGFFLPRSGAEKVDGSGLTEPKWSGTAFQCFAASFGFSANILV